ncbi:MAG: ABC transporter permease [Oscillospiraceae bacterium]|nr:ABC transporter permease [Oscillospiraceae bacterium]
MSNNGGAAKRFFGPRAFAAPYVVWMAAFVVAPVVFVVIYAFTSGDGTFTAENFLEMGRFVSVFARSFWLALVSTVICLALGYPAAYILARESRRVRRAVIVLIMLPMWMNFLLRTFAWMSILERNGLLNRLLGAIGIPPLDIIYTPAAVILGMVYNFLPFMILPIYSVIVKIDRSLVEAAADLGATPRAVFTRVIAPLSLPGVLSGVTMVFVPAVSTFVISKLLGGGKEILLGDLIEMQFRGTAYNPRLGSAIALVMMVVVIVFMYFMNKFGEGEEGVSVL